MRRKILTLLRNPLVLVPPLIILLGIGWQQYTYAGRDLSLPSGANMLPDSSFASADPMGVPTGWSVASSGISHHETSRTKGYASGYSYKLRVHDYQNGDVTTASPAVSVTPGTTYLFKDYYTATAPFSLLVRYTDANGASQLRFVRTYPATANTWSTTSYAFTAHAGQAKVQFVYRLTANGSITLNGPYLEPRQNVYVAPEPAGINTVPNSPLLQDAYDAPQDWSTYHSGTSSADFAYQYAGSMPFLEVKVHDYQNGEAKWQYPPQPTQAHEYYQFSFDYTSDVQVPVVAEYVLQNGARQQQTIGEALPAGEWTTATYQFETPVGATSVFVSAPLKHSGTLSSKAYNLLRMTRPGAASWRQPLVSITFDDGWQLSYANAVPVLQKYGYDATFYINPAAIETPHFMTARELSALSSAGNEIGAHGYDHDDLTALDNSALDYQLYNGRNYLRKAGFTVTDAATPYGRSDAEVQWYARKYFTTLRSTETGVNTRQNLDPYNLKVLYVNDATSSQTIASALQQAKDTNGWLILVYHRIGDVHPDYKSLPVESSTTTTTALRSQMNMLHTSGIRVLPVSAAYAELEKQ